MAQKSVQCQTNGFKLLVCGDKYKLSLRKYLNSLPTSQKSSTTVNFAKIIQDNLSCARILPIY